MSAMFWFQLVVIVALLAAVGWLAVGGGGHMSEPVTDRPDLALPRDGLLDRHDVDRVRFSVGARGYRMDEVDDVLDRLAHEIELREQRIARLEGRAEPDEGSENESAESTASGEHAESVDQSESGGSPDSAEPAAEESAAPQSSEAPHVDARSDDHTDTSA